MRSRKYATDSSAPELRRPRPGQGPVPQVEAEPGLVLEDFEGRYCGAVVAFEKDAVTLEDRHGKRRAFPLPGTFLLEGKRVTLVRPAPKQEAAANKTASGSIAAPDQRAKVAKASRIYVEGKHDAELVEKIWGDDLRDVGVVVEYLEGVDDLPAIVQTFEPGPGRRLGVLVDHLVTGSKETMIAAAVRLGGLDAPSFQNVESVTEAFLANELASKPLGFYTWSAPLRRIFQQDRLLQQHKVKVFVYNQQVVDSVTEAFLAAARRAGIPVVGVYETMPTGFSYQSWMLAEVHALQKAITGKVSTEKL